MLEQYKGAVGKYPNRILFYRGKWLYTVPCALQIRLSDGVSEGQFSTVLGEELDLIRGMLLPSMHIV